MLIPDRRIINPFGNSGASHACKFRTVQSVIVPLDEVCISVDRFLRNITPEQSHADRFVHSDLVFNRQESGIIVRIHESIGSELFLIRRAADRSRLVTRLSERRQKHPGKDGDDGNYHKELYKGEFVEISLEI